MKKKKYADIIDVANHAGVSPATVSRTLNHPDKVRPDTRKRIQHAIDETGYIRNRAAQAIHGKRSGTVGLIVPTLDNAIFSNLIQAFSEQLNEESFTMLVATHGYDLDREYNLLRSLLEHRVEGIGLIGLNHKEETYALLERRETPVVAMWNFSDTSRVSCIGSDNYQAGRLIAAHLLELGHDRIALVFPETAGNDRAADRLKGAIECLSEAGIDVRPNWQISTTYSIKHARAASNDMFSASDHPTAVIAGNDVIAQGVVYSAMSNGFVVPDDVSVAGIGDFSGSADLLPSLSTVRLRSNAIGKRAAEVLIQHINGPATTDPTRIAVELELKPRESTKPN